MRFTLYFNTGKTLEEQGGRENNHLPAVVQLSPFADTDSGTGIELRWKKKEKKSEKRFYNEVQLGNERCC